MTRRVRHLGTVRHMAELQGTWSPILASLPTARACEHAFARFKPNHIYGRTMICRRCGHDFRSKHHFIFFFLVIRFSAVTRPPRLACCGGHEVTGRFYRGIVGGLLTGRWKLAAQINQNLPWPSQVPSSETCGLASHGGCCTQDTVSILQSQPCRHASYSMCHIPVPRPRTGCGNKNMHKVVIYSSRCSTIQRDLGHRHRRHGRWSEPADTILKQTMARTLSLE